MYCFNDVSLRTIEKSDLEILRQLHNDQSTMMNLASTKFIDENDQINWWQNIYKCKDDIRLTLCLTENPEVVLGRIRIQNIDRQNQNCEIGLDVVFSQRRKGFGYKGYNALLNFLFLQMNMNMVYLRFASFNKSAEGLYCKLGFHKTGFLKDYFYRDGRFWNYNIMSMTKQEYTDLPNGE